MTVPHSPFPIPCLLKHATQHRKEAAAAGGVVVGAAEVGPAGEVAVVAVEDVVQGKRELPSLGP